jgi:hypothetical protein
MWNRFSMRSRTDPHTCFHARQSNWLPNLEVTMQSTLRKPLAAALLLSAAAALLAQPAFASDWAEKMQEAQARDYWQQQYRDGYDQGRDGWRHDGREGWRRDDRAPTILDVTPLPGERVGERYRMTVSARFADNASGVDPASVQLRIDGRDVTGASRVDNDGVRFHNNLFPGRHVAEVLVRDRAGNIARRSWQFDVVDAGRGAYRGDDGYGRWGGDGYGRPDWQR